MSDSPIVYEDRLLAFLDILGFSEKLLRSGKDQKTGAGTPRFLCLAQDTFGKIPI
jgi:hypothetical protein